MFVRRLIASLVHSQERKILTSPPSSAFVSSSSSSSSPQTSTSVADHRRVKGAGHNLTSYFRKLIQQTLQFILFGRRKDNVLLANTSINRVLKYSGFDMSSSRSSPKSQLHSEQRKTTSSPTHKNDSQALESVDEPGSLDELRVSYLEARKKNDSCWLDYSQKSCYIYLYRGGGEPSESIAAFDLDGTIIKPKSNKRIPRSATDWDFFSVWTKVKLQQCLREMKARFVIFTNQNGVGLNIVPLDEVQKRIELVTKRLDVPCIVFMAVQKDKFRKPQTGMFQLFNSSFNDSLELNHESSFYCGDAIGYPSHSDADIKFAQRLGLPFLTPEKFVRGVKPKLVAH